MGEPHDKNNVPATLPFIATYINTNCTSIHDVMLAQGIMGTGTLDTIGMIGNCQRPVYSLGVSQHA